MSEEFQSLYPATLTSLTSLVQPSWTGPLSYWRCSERLLWCYVSIMVYCAFTTMVPTWHVICSCFQDNSEDFRLAQPNVASHLPLRTKLVGTIFGVHVGSAWFFSSKRCVILTSCKVNNFQVGWGPTSIVVLWWGGASTVQMVRAKEFWEESLIPSSIFGHTEPFVRILYHVMIWRLLDQKNVRPHRSRLSLTVQKLERKKA